MTLPLCFCVSHPSKILFEITLVEKGSGLHVLFSFAADLSHQGVLALVRSLRRGTAVSQRTVSFQFPKLLNGE